MLTRLREVIEKWLPPPISRKRWSFWLKKPVRRWERMSVPSTADNQHHCFYLMATQGLKKPRGRAVSLAFGEGVVGHVGRRAELINIADVREHPGFKYLPGLKKTTCVHFSVRRWFTAASYWACWWFSREKRLFSETEESFIVTLAMQLAVLLAQAQTKGLFGQFRQTGSGYSGFFRDCDGLWLGRPFTAGA